MNSYISPTLVTGLDMPVCARHARMQNTARIYVYVACRSAPRSTYECYSTSTKQYICM